MITPEQRAENQRNAELKALADHADYEHARAKSGAEMVLPRTARKPTEEELAEHASKAEPAPAPKTKVKK